LTGKKAIANKQNFPRRRLSAMTTRKPITAIPEVNAKALSVDDAVAEVIKGLQLAGACVIRHLYDEKTMAKFDEEVNPHISEEGNTTCKVLYDLGQQDHWRSSLRPFVQTSRRMS
jgi:hypothetical protein